MRDEDRIDRILDKVKTIWKAYPDLRLFQLLENNFPDKNTYYIEDDKLEEALDNVINHISKPDVDNIKLEDLNLKTRTYNLLKKMGIDTVAKLVNQAEEMFIETPHFGRGTICDIMYALGEYDLKLLDMEAPAKPKTDTFALDILDLKPKIAKVLKENSITTVNDLTKQTTYSLRKLPGIGAGSVCDIMDALGAYDLKLADMNEPWNHHHKQRLTTATIEIPETQVKLMDGQDTLNAMILDLIISIVSNPAIYNRRLANNVNTAVKQQEEIVKSKNKLM